MKEEYLGFPTPEETAHTPLGEMVPAETTLHPAEFYCGNLASCNIDLPTMGAVLSEMCIANDGELRTSRWFHDAVELGRFYRGGENDDMTVCLQRSAARVRVFVRAAVQLPSLVWMAKRVELPLERAVGDYAAHIKNFGLDGMRFAGSSQSGNMDDGV
eukprot:4151643-Heterocapsa_arctica.AAC.1